MFSNSKRSFIGLLILAAFMVVAFGPMVEVLLGQEKEDTPPQGAKLDTLWDDLLHYIKVGRAVAAQSYGRAILESGAEPKEVYLLSIKTPESMGVLAKGGSLEGMAEIVSQLSQMISKGYESQRSSPDQIANSINMLGGTLRAYKEASQRLIISGEYALPQLVQKLRDPKSPVSLKHNIMNVIPRMGKDAVRPLSVALQTNDSELQELLANALGEIQYAHAAPRLKELLKRSDVLDRTRKVAESALVACGRGSGATLGKSVAEVFYDMAESYYYQRESIQPDIRYSTANVWYWDENRGLTYRSVAREIFCDIYAMRMSRLALKYDPTFYPSVSLWLAAYLRKEANLPAGTTDPTQPKDMPSPRFFALASPAPYLQEVLARALRDRNSAVALGAIEALSKTAGAKTLIKPVAGGVTPLVAALSYPDRQVRFLAGLSLGNALPTGRFKGSELVMSVFREALRQTGTKTVLLVVSDEPVRNRLKDAIRGAGYNVIDIPDTLAALSAARESSGVDLAVVSAKPSPQAVISRLRAEPILSTLPVVIAADTTKTSALAREDGRAIVISADATAEQVASALTAALQLGIGGQMLSEETVDWTTRVVESIRLLGLTNTGVYDIDQTRGALAEILVDRRPAMLAAASALAVMPAPGAQAAIAELANSSDVDESIRIEAYGSLSESGRRFGNQLPDEATQGIIDVVSGDGSAQLREAAAQALGVLSLPSEKIKSLILDTVLTD